MRCARHHDQDESVLGLPLCLDCYDHGGQVVWNAHVGELWRRTVIGVRRQLARVTRTHGTSVRLSYAKVAEFQRRGVVHLHALLRLDGIDPADRDRIVPPAGVVPRDLINAVQLAAAATALTTDGHGARPAGWRIGWGDQLDVRPLRPRGDGDVTDRAVAAYLTKYATKSTESTGHVSKRLTASTVDYYADPHTHAGRLVETREHTEETTLVVGSWTYAGSGWRTTDDALLATTAAAKARERRRIARDEFTTTRGGNR